MTAKTNRVAVFGATGTAGMATAQALQKCGHDVTSIGRTDPKLANTSFVWTDFTHSADLEKILRQRRIDCVVSCIASRSGLPTDAWAVDHAANLRILTTSEAAGVSHFILLSAICVQKPILAFQHAKLAFEAELKASGLTYSIIRPTAFFKSLSGQVDRLKRGKPYLMFGNGKLTACKPISDNDLGQFIETCLHRPDRQNSILPVGGPGPAITPQEMGAALFEALKLKPKYARVSPKVIRTIGTTLSLAGHLSAPLKRKAELARIGHYYATESMLVWDPAKNSYDADATPEFGSETLFDHYRALAAGASPQDLGEHAVF